MVSREFITQQVILKQIRLRRALWRVVTIILLIA
jgi:hypothetical protein